MSSCSATRLVIGALLVAPLVSGCTDEGTRPSCSPVGISGYVGAGVGPLEARIYFLPTHRLSEPRGIRAIAATDPETGYYSAVLAPGDYRVRAEIRGMGGVYYRASGWTRSLAAADTFKVREGRDAKVVCFHLGSYSLAVRAPPDLDGSWVGVNLLGRQGAYLIGGGCFERGAAEIVIPAVPPDTYIVRLYLEGGDRWYLPATLDRSEADSVVIEAAAWCDETARIPSPGRFQGRIVGSWQELDVGRPIAFLATPDGNRFNATEVSEDGSFELRTYIDRRVCFGTEILGIENWYGASTRLEDAAEYELSPGQLISDFDVIESGIRVDIVESIGADRVLAACDLMDRYGHFVVRSLFTRDDGDIHIPNLTTGTYYLYVNPYGWASVFLPQWHDREDSPDTATPIHVAQDGDVIDLTITLEEGGKIRGNVVGPLGEPVPSPALEITSAHSRHENPHRIKDVFADGWFQIRGLPDGDFKVAAAAQGYEVAWYPQAAEWDSAAVITIHEHGVVEGITIQLRRKTGLEPGG